MKKYHLDELAILMSLDVADLDKVIGGARRPPTFFKAARTRKSSNKN